MLQKESVEESPREGERGREKTETEMLGSLLASPALAAKLCFQTQSMQVEKAKLTATEHCTHIILLQASPVQSSIVLYLSLLAFESLNLPPDWKAW